MAQASPDPKLPTPSAGPRPTEPQDRAGAAQSGGRTLDEPAALTIRHLWVRSETAPLFRAWRASGVQVLLFKGFALSQFVYPLPGARSYGDVDVLIRPGDGPAALVVARSLGWWDEQHVERDVLNHHTLFNLIGPAGGPILDVHRWIIHSYLPGARVQRRITHAVWDRSEERLLDGVPVRVPAAVDAAVVALILQRAWGDGWRVRGDHLADFRLLREREGVEIASIRERARELGCERTVEAFLAEHVPEAASPGVDLARMRRAALRRERKDLVVGSGWHKARMAAVAVGSAPGLARTLLALSRIRRARAENPKPCEYLPRLLPARRDPPRTAHDEIHWHEQTIRWALKLARVAPDDAGTLRVLLLFTQLRDRGWPVVYRIGGDAGGAVCSGMVWIELDGRVLAASKPFRGRASLPDAFTFPAAGS